jgi:hypothetical protein
MSKSPSATGERKPRPDVSEGVAAAVASPEDAPAGLDWQAFSAAYFPGSRRHNLKAIVAYGAYKRSLVAASSERANPPRLKVDAHSIEAVAVEEWEDEGGTSQ